jgi:hypothetical protein
MPKPLENSPTHLQNIMAVLPWLAVSTLVVPTIYLNILWLHMEFVHACFLFCDLRRIESIFTAKGAVNRDRVFLFWVLAPAVHGDILISII